MDISNRKRLILAAIVTLHQCSGDPIGSKSLMNSLDQLSVSSATLRNEMSELTTLGYLEQPHTSAGRVPTSRGVRFYIDNLMQRTPLTEGEQHTIDELVATLDKDPAKAARESADILSDMFHLAAIASTPTGGNVSIVHFKLLRVGRYNIAVLAVTGAGSVLSRVSRINGDFTDSDMEYVENVLNHNLAFVSPVDLSMQLLRFTSSELGENETIAQPILSAAVELVKETASVQTFSEGEENLIHYRELDGSMKDLLEFFSDNHKIRSLLERNPDKISVFVGGENGYGDLDSISVIAARYKTPGGRFGGLGIVGPTRMDYAYIIPRLSYFSQRLESVLA